MNMTCLIFSLPCEVPGRPESSNITVLSDESIEISFSPPLVDGGAPVTAYKVRELYVPSVSIPLLSSGHF